jgi:PAS domain S-box-containing protein
MRVTRANAKKSIAGNDLFHYSELSPAINVVPMVPIKRSGSPDHAFATARLAKLAVLALLYYLFARWSLLFTLEGTHASPIWPPSGIALAAMLLLGHRVWPAILVGAFTANLFAYTAQHEVTFAAAGLFLVIAIGNTLEALAGFHLARKLGIAQHPLSQPQPIFKFMMVTLSVCAISASTGTISTVFGGLAPQADAWSVWLNWWLGDVGGILVFLPILMIWLGKEGTPVPFGFAAVGQWIAMLSGFVALTLLIFSGAFLEGHLHRPLLYLSVLYLAWIAYQCGRHGVSLAILLFASIAVWSTVNGLGPFVTGELNSSLLSLIGFIVLFSVTGLLLAADHSPRPEPGKPLAAPHEVRVHWLTLMVALGLTILAWHMVSSNTEKTAQLRFASAAEEIKHRASDQITYLEELLHNSAAVFAASERVTREEWRTYTEHLEIVRKVPPLHSIAFAAWIPDEEKIAFTNEIRSQGYPSYTIWPAGDRAFYLPVTYIEPPSQANLQALGYDMHSDETRRSAVMRAIETGKTAIAGKTRLVQDTPEKGTSFMMFVPIYKHDAPSATVAERRSALYGMVTGGFRMSELMEGILGKHPTIGLEVFDGSSPSETSRMYSSPELGRTEVAAVALTLEMPLKAANHTWILRATALPAFNATIDRQKAQIVLISGFLISLLLFIAVRSLNVTRESALALATHMTDALRDSESRLRVLNTHMEMATQAGGVGVWDWDIQADNLVWDERMYKIYHLDPATSENNHAMWHKRVHPDDLDRLDRELTEALAGRVAYEPEFRIVLDDGSVRRIKANAQVVRDKAGWPRHMVGVNFDVTDVRQVEESLRTSEKRFRSIFEHAPIGMAMFSLEGRWLSVNNAACGILGYDRSELEGMTFQEVTFPDDLEDNLNNMQLLKEGAIHSYQLEKRYMRKDNRLVWAWVTITLLHDEAGNPLYFIAQIMDIMDRKQKEHATAAALSEKEVLLKEVYHRVKNNLQVITSLLNLQMRTLPEGMARTALKESSERVRAMSLVHEKLYQSSNLSSIALDSYIIDVCRQLGTFAAIAERGIELITELEPVEIGLQLAVPLGLILNELVSNSLKHGFPEGRTGQVRVTLARTGPERNTIMLKVEDNGTGLPPDLDIQSSPSLGLKLVETLTAQIDGVLEISSQGGTCASLVFRLQGPVHAETAAGAYLERS